MKHGVDLERGGESESDRTGVNDPFNGVRTDEAGGQFAGIRLERKVP